MTSDDREALTGSTAEKAALKTDGNHIAPYEMI